MRPPTVRAAVAEREYSGDSVIDRIVPDWIAAVDTRENLIEVELFAQERESLGQAVEKRSNEFTTARACVRRALAQLGLPSLPVPRGERGEPIWPDGIVGSITHCAGYRGCALARADDATTIGIDAEPNAALPDGLLERVALSQELAWLGDSMCEGSDVHWDRLLFSAKEAVYKACFPLTKRWLGFDQVLVSVDQGGQAFSARLLIPGPTVSGQCLSALSGRWLVDDGLVLTAIAVS